MGGRSPPEVPLFFFFQFTSNVLDLLLIFSSGGWTRAELLRLSAVIQTTSFLGNARTLLRIPSSDLPIRSMI